MINVLSHFLQFHMPTQKPISDNTEDLVITQLIIFPEDTWFGFCTALLWISLNMI